MFIKWIELAVRFNTCCFWTRDHFWFYD